MFIVIGMMLMTALLLTQVLFIVVIMMATLVSHDFRAWA